MTGGVRSRKMSLVQRSIVPNPCKAMVSVLAALLSIGDATASDATYSSPTTNTKCQDDTTYVSPMGFPCSAYYQLNCDGFQNVGFTIDETDELLRRCPASCRVTPCDNTSQQQFSRNTSNLASPTSIPASQSTQRQRQLHLAERATHWTKDRGTKGGNTIHSHNESPPAVCQPNWDITCQDNKSFHTHVGFHCEAHVDLDCTMFRMIGFTDVQVYDIINNCPCSCRVECGTWTISPSASPSKSPTISKHPTDVPTDLPSTRPSSSPTGVPTPHPGALPSSRPSASPSSHPTETLSEMPSSLPTFAPTSLVTNAPSMEPTSSPSDEPSSSPTVSPSTQPSVSPSDLPSTLRPSLSPSKLPTFSPSDLPSISPTSGPSAVPTVSLSPSVHPSFLPSTIPSATPTLTPSAMPSLHPSTVPSVSPSTLPSASPSSLPTSTPTSAPTPSSVAMETTFTIPLELNNDLTDGDAEVLQEVMKTFLKLNQKVSTESRDSAVTIEISDVQMEEVVSRSTGDGGGTRRRMKRAKSGKGGKGGVDTDDEDNEDIAIKVGTNLVSTVEVVPVTSEVAAKLRIACNVYPYRPHVVDPGFQFVPRLLGGFATGDLVPMIDHLARESATFTRPSKSETKAETAIQNVSQRTSDRPIASTKPATGAPTSMSTWEYIQSNQALFISMVFAASMFAFLLLSIVFVVNRRRYDDDDYVDEDGQTEDNVVDAEDEFEHIKCYDDGGNQMMLPTSKGKGYKYATSAPTPTNASWRQHIGANPKARKFSPYSPKGVFPEDNVYAADKYQQKQLWAMQQEQMQEEQRLHEWEQQQIGGFAANRFGDNNSVQGLVVKTAGSEGSGGGGGDSGGANKKSKRHNVSKSMPILASVKKKPAALSTREQEPAAAFNTKPPPTTPRRYFRLGSKSGDHAPPDPPSHPRHGVAMQRKMMGSLN